MKLDKKQKLLFWIIIGVCALSAIVSIFGYTPKLLIGLSSIVVVMIWALWNPPKKHKEFNDRDRVQAMSRALGGSPPPELWTPKIPGKAKRKK